MSKYVITYILIVLFWSITPSKDHALNVVINHPNYIRKYVYSVAMFEKTDRKQRHF